MFKQSVLNTGVLDEGYIELLKTVNIDYDVTSQFTKSQKKAYELFKNGKSLLILSPAGFGKSFLIKTLNHLNPQIILTATTGVASYNIGGMTINSFMGIGTAEHDTQTLINRLRYKKNITDRIKMTNILIIDEVSMMSASLFEKIDAICKHFRRNNKFMGGIQLILTGDVLQLNPVFNQNPDRFKTPEDTRLIVESELFNNTFKKNDNIIILKENKRQTSDTLYANLLSRLRIGEQTIEDIQILNDKVKSFNPDFKNSPIHLVGTNKQAQSINLHNMKLLTGEKYNYIANFDDNGFNKNDIEILKKELENQFKIKGLMDLSLKKGSRVMLIKNIDVPSGLINGALGVVQDLNSYYVKVLFDNGTICNIESHEWNLELDGSIVTATQYPLIIAYAITVHRSQSLTLESAIMELDNLFCDHHVYTALSRLTSLDGLYLKSFNPSKIKVNKIMKNYVDSLN